ncbi:MAG: hypothetical protein ACK2UB_10920 [Anaerolineales bacterium]
MTAASLIHTDFNTDGRRDLQVVGFVGRKGGPGLILLNNGP